MDLEAYKKRINYNGKLEPTLEVLTALQKHHLLNVPFENLDIHYKKPIKLNTSLFYDKIINNKRGGFCYELNGLFYALLKEIGYNIKSVSARVYNKEKGYGEEYDHMALIVDFENKEYLADVGFGEFALLPLPIIMDKALSDKRGIFFFDMYDENYLRVSKKINDEIFPQYIFTRENHDLKDYSGMCHFHQTSSASHFTQKKLISLATENGRITLTDDKLKITDGKNNQETAIISETDFNQKLKEIFGISHD